MAILAPGRERRIFPTADPTNPFWWLRWVPGAVLFAVVLYWIYVVGRVAIIPVLASFSLAYILSPLVERIERAHISRPVAVLIAIGIVILAAFLFSWLVVPDLWAQFVNAGSIIFENFNEKNAVKARAWLREVSPFLDRAIGYRVYRFLRNPNDVVNASRDWTAGHLTDFFAKASGVLDLLLIPFFVYYILVDFGNWRSSMDELIPPRFREPFSRLFDEVGRILQSYVLGQLLIAMIMAVLYAAGFILLKVPAWAGLAALSGFLNVIPYVGTLSGLVLATVFTFADTKDIMRVLGVCVVFIVVQTIEGYVLTPRILGDRLSLHPMAVFLGLLIGGKLFGFLGILLAVPVIAVSLVFLKFFRELYKASNFYHAGEAPQEQLEQDTPEIVAKAAETVLTEQVEEQTGDELLAPDKSEDDVLATEKSGP